MKANHMMTDVVGKVWEQDFIGSGKAWEEPAYAGKTWEDHI